MDANRPICDRCEQRYQDGLERGVALLVDCMRDGRYVNGRSEQCSQWRHTPRE